MTASAWTDDRIGRLKTLWLEGQTAEQIARDLANGITRSAVLGKVHRLGLSAGRAGRPPKRAAVSPRPPRPAPSRARPDTPILCSPPAPVQSGLVNVLSVRRYECRWPFGEPGTAEFSLCGRPIIRGAFCGSHAALAYRPAPETSRTLDRLARLE
jgi:GcrA cell cycle regulator